MLKPPLLVLWYSVNKWGELRLIFKSMQHKRYLYHCIVPPLSHQRRHLNEVIPSYSVLHLGALTVNFITRTTLIAADLHHHHLI